MNGRPKIPLIRGRVDDYSSLCFRPPGWQVLAIILSGASFLLGEKERAVVLLRVAHEKRYDLGIEMMTEMDLESICGYPPFDEFIRPKG